MKRWAIYAGIVAIVSSPLVWAAAPATYQTFQVFISGSPRLPVAVTSGDLVPVIRGSTTYAADLSTIGLAATGLSITASFPSFFGSVPTDIAQVNVGAYSATSEIPAGVLQGLVSKIKVPTGYTSQPWPNTAVSGYSLNGNVVAGNSAVALFGFSGSAASGASAYGSNVVVSNGLTLQPFPNGGFDFPFLVGYEADVNIGKKSGAVVPSGTTHAFLAAGQNEGGALPTVGETDAFTVIDFVPSGAWTNAFKSPGFRVTGTGKIIATAMPTNCTSQASGTLWNDTGTVKICP